MPNSVNFLNDEGGATAIEYGLLAALVAVVIIAVLSFLGAQLSSVFGSIATAL